MDGKKRKGERYSMELFTLVVQFDSSESRNCSQVKRSVQKREL